MRQPKVIALVVSALLGAGCGGDKAGQAVPPTTSPVPAVTTSAAPTTAAEVVTTATAPAAKLDKSAKASAATLQASDFPTGFSPVPEADGGGLNIELLWADLLGCLGVLPSSPAGIGTSSTFKRGLATQARATVEYTDESSASAIAAAVAGPKFQECADTVFAADVKRSAPEGGVPGPVAVAAAKAAPVAPKATSFRITASVMLADLTVPLFQDFYVIYTGGAIVRAVFLSPGSEFPQDLEQSVLAKVVSRT